MSIHQLRRTIAYLTRLKFPLQKRLTKHAPVMVAPRKAHTTVYNSSVGVAGDLVVNRMELFTVIENLLVVLRTPYFNMCAINYAQYIGYL